MQVNDMMESDESHYKRREKEKGTCLGFKNSTPQPSSLESNNCTEDELLRELAKILVEAYLGEQPYGGEKGSDILSGFNKRTS